jgi:hypothetical protein
MTLQETIKDEPASLPQHLLDVLKTLPARVTRRYGADLVFQHILPVSHRTLEAWPLPTRHVNGKALIETATLFEIAYAKLAAAPVVMSGRRTTASYQSALLRNVPTARRTGICR